MSQPIAHLAARLLRLLWPASGRHRRPALVGTHDVDVRKAPDVPAGLSSAFGSLLYDTPLHGEDSPLVRPYFAAHEHREEAKRQRTRRRALWLAVHGVDVGPRHIHGVEVAA